jgi:hypothetical protein
MASAVSEQQANLRHVIDLCNAHGGRIAHDLSDPREAAFLDDLLCGSGKTPERYPALFERVKHQPGAAPLRRGAAPHALPDDASGSFSANQLIDYISTIGTGTPVTSAHATLTRTKPVSWVKFRISAVNVQGSQTNTLATGYGYEFGVQTVGVLTDPQTAEPLPSTGINSGLMSWIVEYTDGTYDISSQNTPWAYNTNGIPGVQAPVQYPGRTSGNLNAIVIGLSRGYNSPGNNSDIDYWFWQTQWQNTTLLVPLQGSMKFKYPIAPLSSANPALEFYLARTEGGMSDLSVTNTAPYLPFYTIDPGDNTKLNFTLLAGTNSAGNAVNFGLSPWVSDTQTFFTTIVTVTLNGPTGPTSGWSTIMSVPNPKTQTPVDGVGYVWPLVYVWHCLVAGTQITMADGTTRAIETLNAGDVVMSGSTPRPVLATLAQPHWGTVYALTTAGGRSLTCSGTHPIVTPSGAVQASALQVGSAVSTPSGTDTIAAIATQQQNGDGLFNLWLDPTTAPANATSMIANGLVVGDYLMQVQLLALPPIGAAHRAKLPERLHTDFASYLEDKARAASV